MVMVAMPPVHSNKSKSLLFHILYHTSLEVPNIRLVVLQRSCVAYTKGNAFNRFY